MTIGKQLSPAILTTTLSITFSIFASDNGISYRVVPAHNALQTMQRAYAQNDSSMFKNERLKLLRIFEQDPALLWHTAEVSPQKPTPLVDFLAPGAFRTYSGQNFPHKPSFDRALWETYCTALQVNDQAILDTRVLHKGIYLKKIVQETGRLSPGTPEYKHELQKVTYVLEHLARARLYCTPITSFPEDLRSQRAPLHQRHRQLVQEPEDLRSQRAPLHQRHRQLVQEAEYIARRQKNSSCTESEDTVKLMLDEQRCTPQQAGQLLRALRLSGLTVKNPLDHAQCSWKMKARGEKTKKRVIIATATLCALWALGTLAAYGILGTRALIDVPISRNAYLDTLGLFINSCVSLLVMYWLYARAGNAHRDVSRAENLVQLLTLARPGLLAAANSARLSFEIEGESDTSLVALNGEEGMQPAGSSALSEALVLQVD